MKQGEKKTLLYVGITTIGLLWCSIMVAGLYNQSPDNAAKTVQASLADATPADTQAMHAPHPPVSNPANPASPTFKDKNRQTSSPNTADAPNKNHVHRRQGFSYLRQAYIVLAVAIVVTIIICMIKRFNNPYGCRTSYDNLLVAPSEQDYYALLRINAATIGYGHAGAHSLSQVVHKLKAIAKDPRNKGLFIVLHSEKEASRDDLMIGHCLTLVSAIEAYKQATGRTVIAYGATFMPKHYLVATVADQIYVAQAGTLTLRVPVVLPQYTLRNVHEQPLNDKAQLWVDKAGNKLGVGRYKRNVCKKDEEDNFKKCYQDPYIQRLSQRQVTSLDSLCAARDDKLKSIIINSGDARRTKLVDDCGEKQKIIAKLGYPVQECPVRFRQLSLEEKRALSQQPAIEVVFIAGLIDELLVARIAPLLTLLAEAAQVKGIILVIDSQGGKVVSAKAISSMLKRLKEAGKMIFAYTEGRCLSGAYRIGCTAHKIFARETAWIGSIGAKITLNHDVPDRKENRYKKYLQSSAEALIAYVASCRAESLADSNEKDLAAMVRSTEARIFHGQRAKDLQLIDEIGTLDTTIAAMKTTLGCPDIKVFYREHPHA